MSGGEYNGHCCEDSCDAVEQTPKCTDGERDHDWTSEGCGGNDENPGVWSLGGTVYQFKRRCRACGTAEIETHYGDRLRCDSRWFEARAYAAEVSE